MARFGRNLIRNKNAVVATSTPPQRYVPDVTYIVCERRKATSAMIVPTIQTISSCFWVSVMQALLWFPCTGVGKRSIGIAPEHFPMRISRPN